MAAAGLIQRCLAVIPSQKERSHPFDTMRTANAMSIRQLAAAIGLSIARTHTLVKKGMPTEPEAAKAWRKANIGGTRSKVSMQLPELARDFSQVKERIEYIPQLPNSLEEAEKIFLELSVACNIAAARAQSLTGSSEPAIDELGRRWSLLAADLLRRKLEVVEKVQQLRLQSGELVVYAEVRDKFVGFLHEVRRLAMAMPASMAMRCNPNDPPFAQRALEEWLRGYFRLLNSNEGGKA
jgi:hypothetical protein